MIVVEYTFRTDADGAFWIDVVADRGGAGSGSIGPFDTEAERQRAYDDMTSMVRSLGGSDLMGAQ